MATDFDINTALDSVNAAVRFATAAPWNNYTLQPFGPFGVAFASNDSSQLETYIRKFSTSAFHPVGTAAISPVNAAFGVVNPDLTVKGVSGLRVVDASVFVSNFFTVLEEPSIHLSYQIFLDDLQPFIPSCHTQGPVYLLAERASDLIKAAG